MEQTQMTGGYRVELSIIHENPVKYRQERYIYQTLRLPSRRFCDLRSINVVNVIVFCHSPVMTRMLAKLS